MNHAHREINRMSVSTCARQQYANVQRIELNGGDRERMRRKTVENNLLFWSRRLVFLTDEHERMKPNLGRAKWKRVLSTDDATGMTWRILFFVPFFVCLIQFRTTTTTFFSSAAAAPSLSYERIYCLACLFVCNQMLFNSEQQQRKPFYSILHFGRCLHL